MAMADFYKKYISRAQRAFMQWLRNIVAQQSPF